MIDTGPHTDAQRAAEQKRSRKARRRAREAAAAEAERAEMRRVAAAAWSPRARPQTPLDVLTKETRNGP